MTLALASDHGGLELKNYIKSYLATHYPQYNMLDFGTQDTASVDYPDYAKKVAQSILKNECECGILVCGTGIGISIAANRFKGIRAALVHNDFTAEMSKAHNNANILCLGGRTTSKEDACRYIDIWLKTPFEGGRHQIRLDKLE